MFCGDLAIKGTSVWIPARLRRRPGGVPGVARARPGARIRRACCRRTDRSSTIRSACCGDYIEHRREREEQVIDALRAGDRTPEAIVARVYRGLKESLVPLAQESVTAHLLQAAAGRTRPDRATTRGISLTHERRLEQHRRFHQRQPRSLRRRAEAVPRDSEHQRAAGARRATCAARPSGPRMRCARAGMQNVRLIDTPGNPVVYGDWLDAPGKPTILFYGHYDVQPVDPLNLWTTPPFEATVRDGEIYARGAADDKGQVFMHIKAIEAHLKTGGQPAVQHQVLHRGRRGGRQRPPRRLRPRPQAGARAPTSSSSPTRRCSTAAFRRSAMACAGWPISRSTCAARRATCTPDRSAAPWPTRRSCWRRCWRR